MEFSSIRIVHKYFGTFLTERAPLLTQRGSLEILGCSTLADGDTLRVNEECLYRVRGARGKGFYPIATSTVSAMGVGVVRLSVSCKLPEIVRE
jgi:hypothetical protein